MFINTTGFLLRQIIVCAVTIEVKKGLDFFYGVIGIKFLFNHLKK